MSRFGDCFLGRLLGLCQVWREYFRIPDSLRYLPGPSYAEVSDSRLLPESDLESQYASLPASDHFQNGSVREQEHVNLRRKTEELQQQLQGESSRYEALIAGLEAQLKEESASSSSRIEELQTELQLERSRYEERISNLKDELKEESANSSSRIEELQTELQLERSRYEERISNLEGELKEENDHNQSRIDEIYNSSSTIEELRRQLEGERHRYEQRIVELEDQLKRLQIYTKDETAAQAEQIQKLVKQLELAERQNSHDFAGGESFLDSGATPHLLNKAVERVNQTSGNFTKLLMPTLKNGGVDCTEVAKALAPSVSFERAAHTKYVYQALVCKVLYTDFESECFKIEDNAPESLDPEQSKKENFQRYQQLIVLENPDELVYEDATDSDFRRFCNKKRKDLIAALSLTGTPGVDDVGALIFGEVFGPDGIRRGNSAGTQSQIKVASAFVKFALSVFLVHKLSFSMHPIARIFRVKDAAEFIPEYMEPVVASADSDDEDADSISLNVGFMVVPGFYVNRIVVHSRVYTVKSAM